MKQQAQRFIHKTYRGLGTNIYFTAFGSANSKDLDDSYALLKAYADDHWSEDNRNLYALWPRLSYEAVENNQKPSTWFMRNGSFLRLKSLEFGYTVPTNVLKKVFVKNFRIYFSGTNLLTFSPFKLWDPEMGGNGLGYPVQRVFNLGAQISF